MRTTMLFITLIGLVYMSSVFGCGGGKQNSNTSNRNKDKKCDTRQALSCGSKNVYFATSPARQKCCQKPS